MPKLIRKNLGWFLSGVLLSLIVGFCFVNIFLIKAQEQIKVFPTIFDGDWQNPEAAFSQDLGEFASFEEFNQENSAYSLIISEMSPEATATESTTTEETTASTEETLNQSSTSSEETTTTTNSTTTGQIKKPSFFARILEKLKNLFSEEVKAEEEESESVFILSDFSIPDEFQESGIKNVQLRLSLAGKGDLGDKLVINYYYQNAWQSLVEYDLENEISNAENSGYFLYALPIFQSWDDLENLKIRFTSFGEGQVYLDAVWLEVEYEEEEEVGEENTLELISERKDFKSDETPTFKFRYQKERGFFEGMGASLISLFRDEYKDINIKATVSGLNISPNIRYEGNGEFFIDLVDFEKPRQFKPGRYFLKIEIENKGKISVQEQEFTLGVLAINTNKSIYLPNGTAYLQMAALRDDGHTICDANLSLTITAPNGKRINPAVQRSGQCGPDNVTDVPDYFSYYQTGGAGTYQMKLTNLDNGYEVIDSFEVRDSLPFDIERIGPTRIYPKAAYQMTLRIKANQDFIGEIIEEVPASFEIVTHESTQIRTKGDTKEIIWDVDWKAGENYQLSYQFDAPDISPYLYLLGPLKIGDFEEIRQWQIASDVQLSFVDFEADFGDWTDQGGDCYWQRHVGDLGSGSTGADYDHTYGDATHYKISVECSSSVCQGTDLEADIVSTTFDADVYAISISFWYHMYGAGMGDLHLDVNDGTWHNDVMAVLSGQQEQTSETAAFSFREVDLSAYTGDITIRFRYDGVTSYAGDVCLDDIEITGELKNAAPNTPNLDETPAFPNMLASTTTPVFGGFSATDDDGDDVEFWVEWDTDASFGDPATNTTATTTSGATTTYTITSALSEDTVYWWRVKARDPGGSNEWSSYSAKRSITASTSISFDQWFQTTGDQFNTDTLTDTATTATSVKIGGW